ncbi:MAG: MMPL family transporter [Nanobdellota archaeon]
MLLIIIALTVSAFYLSGQVGTKSMDNQDTLPEDIEVIKTFDIIENNFGGSDTLMIAIQVEPRYAESDEVRDMYDPEVVEYMHIIGQMAERDNDITMASSLSTVLYEMNGGKLPNSKRNVIELADRAPVSDYVNDKRDLAVINLRLSGSYDGEEIVHHLQDLIDDMPSPAGVKVNVAGNEATQPVVQEKIGPDMQKTSIYSLIGILAVLFALFLSFRYAITPLVVIGLGILWAFGFFGLVGINMSPATSGAISMIMGIGIDFGIQTLSRFRQEVKDKKPEEAMEITMNNVLMPMTTTTVAALIGFRAMSMGDLSVMQDLGTIMSYGVTFCFLSAITVIPVVSIYGEKIGGKK